MKDLSGLNLRAELFDGLAQLCANDPKFPKTWANWQCLMHYADQQSLAEKNVVRTPIDLDPWAFADWCRSVGIIPCVEALRAYAIVKRTRERIDEFASLQQANVNQQMSPDQMGLFNPNRL